MTDTMVLDALRGVKFLHDIADEHLERLATIARPVEYAAGTELFHQSDTAKDVYVIISGRVSLVICGPKVGCRQLMEVGQGELVGWSPLVGNERLSDTARALEPTKGLAIDGEELLAICHAHPEFGFEFMHRAAVVLAHRLGATRLRLLELAGVRLPDVQIESD